MIGFLLAEKPIVASILTCPVVAERLYGVRKFPNEFPESDGVEFHTFSTSSTNQISPSLRRPFHKI